MTMRASFQSNAGTIFSFLNNPFRDLLISSEFSSFARVMLKRLGWSAL